MGVALMLPAAPSAARAKKKPAPAPSAKSKSAARAQPQPKAPALPMPQGKFAVFTFAGEGGHRVQQQVVSSLRAKGLKVITNLRPVDSAEQYREMAVTLNLVAYLDGEYVGRGRPGQRDRATSGAASRAAGGVDDVRRRPPDVADGDRQGALGSDKPGSLEAVRRRGEAAEGRTRAVAHRGGHAAGKPARRRG